MGGKRTESRIRRNEGTKARLHPLSSLPSLPHLLLGAMFGHMSASNFSKEHTYSAKSDGLPACRPVGQSACAACPIGTMERQEKMTRTMADGRACLGCNAVMLDEQSFVCFATILALFCTENMSRLLRGCEMAFLEAGVRLRKEMVNQVRGNVTS